MSLLTASAGEVISYTLHSPARVMSLVGKNGSKEAGHTSTLHNPESWASALRIRVYAIVADRSMSRLLALAPDNASTIIDIDVVTELVRRDDLSSIGSRPRARAVDLEEEQANATLLHPSHQIPA